MFCHDPMEMVQNAIQSVRPCAVAYCQMDEQSRKENVQLLIKAILLCLLPCFFSDVEVLIASTNFSLIL